MYKISSDGTGTFITSEDLGPSMNFKYCPFSLERFQEMCILSGCDYLKSLPGIGLQRSRKAIGQYGNHGVDWMIDNLPMVIGRLSIIVCYSTYQSNQPSSSMVF